MFKVKHKETGEIRTVYGLNGLFFLFHENGHWVCDNMNHYEPVED